MYVGLGLLRGQCLGVAAPVVCGRVVNQCAKGLQLVELWSGGYWARSFVFNIYSIEHTPFNVQ